MIYFVTFPCIATTASLVNFSLILQLLCIWWDFMSGHFCYSLIEVLNVFEFLSILACLPHRRFDFLLLFFL